MRYTLDECMEQANVALLDATIHVRHHNQCIDRIHAALVRVKNAFPLVHQYGNGRCPDELCDCDHCVAHYQFEIALEALQKAIKIGR